MTKMTCGHCQGLMEIPVELAYQVVAAHRGKAGGLARAAGMTQEERTEAARVAGKARQKGRAA